MVSGIISYFNRQWLSQACKQRLIPKRILYPYDLHLSYTVQRMMFYYGKSSELFTRISDLIDGIVKCNLFVVVINILTL